MKDQVDALKAMGIKADFINSSLSSSKYNEVLENINNDEYKIIYVAPERLDSIDFINIMKYKNVVQVAIDEAHCVSQWGHDFRSSYKRIPHFIRSLEKRPIVTAFTATASDEVREDILKILGLVDPNIYITGFDRENLSINIVKSSSKNRYLLEYLEHHKYDSGIIYAATRKEVENIYEGLLKRNISVSKYHAGLSNEERKNNQEEFIKDNIKIMVATNAFGMGIDKPNIRWIVHYNMPQSIENYYQEIGRAGRDGEKSECTLLFTPGDIHTHKYLIDMIVHYNMPQSIENYYQEIGRAGRDGEKSECTLLFTPGDIHTHKYLIDIGIENQNRKLVQYKKLQQMVDLIYSNTCYRSNILNYFGEDTGIENQNRKLVQYKKLQQMVDLIYSNTCYRSNILNYFGEDTKSSCNNCSNCLNEGIVTDKTLDAQKVISCIARMKRGYGVTMIVDVLRGSKNKKVLDLGFNTLTTYGIMKNYSNEDLKTFINTLVSHGFLEIKENPSVRGSYPTVVLNEQSMKVIKNEIKVEFKEDKIIKESRVKNELYERLVELRREIATNEKIAPYMVFGDATLNSMASSYASCKDEMLLISGVGQIKYEKYGKYFEELIKEYVNEKNIDKENIRDSYASCKDEMLLISGVGQIKYEKYGKYFEELIKEYVNEKNIDKENIRDLKKTNNEFFEVNTDHNLYNMLKDLRNNISKVEGVLDYMVLSKNTLKEISGRYPLDEEKLKDIGGIGPVKINKYGKDILEIVKNYVIANNIDVKWNEKKRLKLVLDGDNRKTNEVALDLLNQGMSVKEVSDDLEVSVSAVLGYVYDYIKEDNIINFDINTKSYYNESEKELILNKIDQFGDDKIGLIKKSLPENIKYESIRAIILEKYI